MTHAGGESGFLTEIGLQLNQILPNGGIFLLAASGDASGYLFHVYSVRSTVQVDGGHGPVYQSLPSPTPSPSRWIQQLYRPFEGRGQAGPWMHLGLETAQLPYWHGGRVARGHTLVYPGFPSNDNNS